MATDGRANIVLSATDKTAAAFASAKRNILGLQSSAAGINAALGPLLGTVGLLGGALSLLNFKSIINGVDALNDLKDATGASIENISALEDVAARTGTSFDTVGTALVKFNAQLKEAKPGSGPAEVLKAIGLEAERLKALDPAEALRQTAVALAGYADDGNKARIVQELFGKSVREVAPFLNDLATQGKLNATVTTKQAEEAEKFNHQLSALGKNFKDVARSVVGDMIPALNQFFEALAGIQRGGGFFASLGKQDDARNASHRLRTVVGEIERLQAAIDRKGGDAGMAKKMSELRAEAAALSQEALRASDALKGFADKAKPLPKPTAAADIGLKDKPGAPDIPTKAGTSGIDKARTEALANLRKVIEGRVKAIGAGLDEERDLQRFHEDFSRGLYSAGEQSLEQFYAAQDQARQDSLAAVRKATAEEVAEREKLLSSKLLKTPGDRQEVQNQIEEARTKLRVAEREADQAAQLSAFERQRATEALRDDVAALDAQIRELSGDAAAGDLLNIANQVRAAQRLLVQAGEDPAAAEQKAQRLRGLLVLQQEFNASRARFAQISQDAAIAEERLLLASESSGAGLLETERAVGALRRKAVAEFDALIAKTRELVQIDPANTALSLGLRDLEAQAARVRAQMDPTKLRLDAAAGDIGNVLAEGFGRAVKDARDLKSIVKDIGDRIFDIVNEEILIKPLAATFTNFLKGAGGQGFGENILGKLFGLNAPAAAAPAAGQAVGAIAAVGSDVAAASGQAASAAAISTAITAASAAETAAISGALAATSATETAALSAVIATSAATETAALVTSIAASTVAITTAIGLASASKAGGDALGNFIKVAGFDAGGFTGNMGPQEPAGIVHGQEYVFSAPAVKRIGVGALEQIHTAALAGGRRKLPKYEHGGYVGLAPRRAAPAQRDSGALAGDRGGSTYVDLRGLTVNSHGQMDRMAEERAARNVARRAERYLSRRGA
jgi:hypothetical protein